MMRILGIECTCDETGVALVEDGRKILTNIISSSVVKQLKFGGIVPEVAAREQVSVMIPVLKESLSGYSFDDVDAIAVSYGPGLIGSLLVGVETAKSLALALNRDLIGVNHLVGHIYANWLGDGVVPVFPAIALIVSGGHTDLVLVKKHGSYKLLGSTLDDAAGEAFDKVAKKLGLKYPGGPEIERVGSTFSGKSIFNFPRAMINSEDFNFSFSGIKTSVVNAIDNANLSDATVSNIADEFQKTVVEILVKKALKAASKFSAESIIVGGGVAANTYLRKELETSSDLKIFFPDKKHSVDNGAMIAAAAFFNYKKVDPLKLQADPSLHF